MSDQARKWIRHGVDYAALVVFAAVYFLGGRDFMKATAAIVIASILALIVGGLVERRIAWLPLFVGGTAALFGGLTLIFHDPRIMKIKPTVIQGDGANWPDSALPKPPPISKNACIRRDRARSPGPGHGAPSRPGPVRSGRFP